MRYCNVAWSCLIHYGAPSTCPAGKQRTALGDVLLLVTRCWACSGWRSGWNWSLFWRVEQPSSPRASERRRIALAFVRTAARAFLFLSLSPSLLRTLARVSLPLAFTRRLSLSACHCTSPRLQHPYTLCPTVPFVLHSVQVPFIFSLRGTVTTRLFEGCQQLPTPPSLLRILKITPPFNFSSAFCRSQSDLIWSKQIWCRANLYDNV